MRLIADIGGTNARLALSDAGQITKDSTRSYANANWESLYAVISDFMSNAQAGQIDEIVVAVAGPVQDNRAELTNFSWSVEAAKLATLTGAGHARLLNDLTALGYAVPKLQTEQLKLVREGTAKHGPVSQSLVVGMGTGFNVSPVLQNAQNVICPAVEAGHISMPQNVMQELSQLGFGPEAFPTIESLFSGRGLTTFARMRTGSTGLTGPEAIAAYDVPKHAEITQTIDQYAALLGCLLQSLSLAYMPSAGIYLAGGVARSLMKVASVPCVSAFEHGASSLLPTDTPVWSINDDLAALTGCAEFAL